MRAYVVLWFMLIASFSLGSKYASDVVDVAVVLMREGIALDAKGKMWEAVRKFRSAAKHDPYSSQHRNNLGLCLYRLGFQFADLKLLRESAEQFDAALKMALDGTLDSTRENVRLLDAAFRERYPYLCKYMPPYCFSFHERFFPDGAALQEQLPMEPPTHMQQLQMQQYYLQQGRDYEISELEARRDKQLAAEEEEDMRRAGAQREAQLAASGAVSLRSLGSSNDNPRDVFGRRSPPTAAAPNPNRRARPCKPEELRLDLGAGDMERVVEAMQTFAEVLQRCGVVVLEGVYDLELVAEAARHHDRVFDAFHARLVADASQENTTTSWRRSEGRWEVKLPATAPFTSQNLIASPALFPLLKRALGSQDIELDTFSSVTSLAGSPAQHWHADVDDIFAEQAAAVGAAAAPCFGLVVFAPLLNIDAEKGPPEFLLGSHMRLECLRAGNDQCADLGTFVATAKRGSAVVFDIRILHRGGANSSPARRSALYLSYTRAWFRDTVNFAFPHSRSFDSLESRQLRRLLTRVDQHEYVRALEEAVARLGSQDQVEAIRSTRRYSSLDYGLVDS